MFVFLKKIWHYFDVVAAILDFETLMSFLWFLKLYQWIKRISKHNNCWFLIENILFMSNSKAFLIWPMSGPKMGMLGTFFQKVVGTLGKNWSRSEHHFPQEESSETDYIMACVVTKRSKNLQKG